MSFFKLCVQYHALMKYLLRCKDVGVKFDLNNRVSCVMCADAFITWPLWFDSKIQTHRSYFQNLLTLIAEALHGAHNNLAINTFNFILFVVIQIESWSAWIVLKYSFYHFPYRYIDSCAVFYLQNVTVCGFQKIANAQLAPFSVAYLGLTSTQCSFMRQCIGTSWVLRLVACSAPTITRTNYNIGLYGSEKTHLSVI